MKILYLFFGDDLSGKNGVIKKVFSKIEMLGMYADSCHLVSFSAKVQNMTTLSANTFVYPIKKTNGGKFFKAYRGRRELLDSVDLFLRENGSNYDKVVMRYPLSDPNSLRLFRRYKIAVEHNTIEEKEMKVDLRKIYQSIPFSLKPGFFIDVYDRVLSPFLYEKLFSRKVLKEIPLGICVTDEIAEYEKGRLSSYNTVVITNGIKLKDTPLRLKQKRDTIIRGFLLAGHNAPWHGIDRIIDGIKTYKLAEKFEIHLIGNVDEAYVSQIRNLNLRNVIVHNSLSEREIIELTRDFDFSFGSLALHRAGLKQGSPLKVRESLLMGFPIVNAYFDCDIEASVELKKYCLTVANNNEPLNFEIIKEFIDGINVDNTHPHKIRALATPLIDMNLKMKTLVSKLSQY